MRAFRIVVIVAAIFIGFHVVPALMDRDSPPLACQLAGGQWSIWDGWTCR